MGKKAGLSSANSQEQVKARVSRVKQAPAHDWLARVAMKFEVLEVLYPDSRKAGTNNFDLTPHFSLTYNEISLHDLTDLLINQPHLFLPSGAHSCKTHHPLCRDPPPSRAKF